LVSDRSHLEHRLPSTESTLVLSLTDSGYGIGNIPSTSLASWRYEFLIIGAVCSLWAIAIGFIIPDAPHSTKRLTRREAVVVVSRKRDDYHVVEKRQLKWDQVKETFKDVKTYLYFLLGFFANVPNGATSNCERAPKSGWRI
jgi:hypothetical protein